MTVLALALCNAPAPAPVWRLVAAALAVALAWVPVGTIVFQRGAAAVRHFEWTEEGRWVLTDGTGARSERVTLDIAGCGALGPWILLVWKVPRSTRRYALLDADAVGARPFRALRARLNLNAHGRKPVPADDNC